MVMEKFLFQLIKFYLLSNVKFQAIITLCNYFIKNFEATNKKINPLKQNENISKNWLTVLDPTIKFNKKTLQTKSRRH